MIFKWLVLTQGASSTLIMVLKWLVSNVGGIFLNGPARLIFGTGEVILDGPKIAGFCADGAFLFVFFSEWSCKC